MARYYAKLDLKKNFEAVFALPLFTGDSGNTVRLEFYHDGQPYDMSGAQIYARRSDGTVLTTAAVTSGNQAEFTLYNNMFSCLGELQVQVSVLDVYGNFLTSGVLYFTVQEGFSSQSKGEGSDDFCDLTALIRQVSRGIGQLERAEAAADTVEGLAPEMQSFLSRFSNLEDQVIASLDMNGLDLFIKGIGLVTSSETTDSEFGPISTEYQWPVVAEYSDTFGSITATQTRFYNGKLERRVGTGSENAVAWGQWKEYLFDVLNELTTVYRYKGSVDNVTLLPEQGQRVGDVYNVVMEGLVTRQRKLIPLSYVSFEYDSNAGLYSATYNYDSSAYSLENDEVYDFYTKTGNQILWCMAAGETGNTQFNVNPAGNTVWINIDMNDSSNQITTEDDAKKIKYLQVHGNEEEGQTVDVSYKVEAGGNVVWSGSYWDVLAGTVDLSNYAEKATTLAGYGITDAYTKQQTADQIEQRIKTIELTSSIDGNSWFDGVDWSFLNNLTSQLVKIKINYTDDCGMRAQSEGYVISVYGIGSYYSNTEQYLILGENESSVTYVRRKYDESYFTQEDPYWTSCQVVDGLDG
ncbi:MAG: hypothetical protein SO147_09890, partial [Clostridia bacterium]|nr:hypothetical protein [Clostridia bacterium]